MIHLPWVVMEGNSGDLRKEADTLDTVLRAMVGIYKTKFALSEDEIIRLLDEETWFSGREAADFNFRCTVIEDADDFSIAAKVRGFDMTKFKNFKMMETIEEKTQADNAEEIKAEEQTTEETPVVEDKAEETVAETAVEVPSEETTPEETTPEEMIPRAEADKRVYGMQSTMAKKLDALRKDYEARITDFENQLKGRDEELAQARADATRLTAELETAKNEGEELSQRISALTDDLRTKTESLAKLNQAVLTPNMDAPKKDWRNLKGKEFFDFLRDHPELAK